MSIDLDYLLKFAKEFNILYVEDDEEVSLVFRETLNIFFNKVYFAVNGLDGLEKFENNSIDLILTDITMPLMNGLDMSKEIKKINQDIPIIITSAHDDIEYFVQMLKLNVDGFLLKSIDFEQFNFVLNRVIEKIVLRKEKDKYQEELKRKLEEQTEKLKKHYYTNKLTGLPNRYALMEDIVNLNLTKLALIDINKFSAINNTYGVKVGDYVLEKVADILLKNKLEDCLLYKISGDQFVITSAIDFTDDECAKRLSNISDKVSKTRFCVNIDDVYIEIDVSLTIAIVKGYDNFDSLLSCADSALQYAKKTNKSFIKYTPELDEYLNYKKTLNAMLLVNKALEDDKIIPYYQPIIKSNKITYECLVRIIDENNNIITPNYFIDEIKGTIYYSKLTHRMIEKSFKYFENKNIDFSINLSFHDISNEYIIDYLLYKLEEYNLYNNLIIEILENESIIDFDLVRNFVEKMKSLGVRIAIDDFGSGYSNFNYILELEPNFIKIDGSIIKKIHNCEKSFKITKAIVLFAKELNIKIIAEFIHNQNVYDKIFELEVDGYQGYFFSEPIEDITNYNMGIK